MMGAFDPDPHYLSPLEEARLECEAFRELARKRGEAEEDLRDSLQDLVTIINKAGLLNLSRGVELGATSWYVKASDRLKQAEWALSNYPAPEIRESSNIRCAVNNAEGK